MSAEQTQEKRAAAHFEAEEKLDIQNGSVLAPTTTGGTSAEKGYAGSIIGDTLRVESRKTERQLLRKLDIVILPLAFLLYLSAYLDRGNLGNSRLMGLQKTALDGSDEKYSLALSCFYITYIVLSIPGTLLAKAVVPSTSISIGALIWAVAATAQAGVQNPAGVYVCRLFVGVGEAMFGQAVALYFSYWYTKSEISKRIALFIGAGALAGAFGGLIAYGVARIEHPKLEPWRVLFLIEGCPSVLLAICVFLFLPSRPQTSRYLTESERTLAITRLNADSLNEGNSGIDWSGVKRAFLDWKIYAIALAYSCMNLTLGSVSGFLPTIIKGLGYTAAQAQLFTVPPYAVALVFTMILSTLSDRFRSRGLFAAGVYISGIIGWAILLTVDPVHASKSDLHVRYFGCIAVVCAGYGAIPLIISWQSNNSGSQSQRAVALGMLNTIGQCLGILASYSFPSHEGPRYTKGIILNLAFQVLGFAICIGMTLFYRWENKRRDRVEGGRPPAGTVLNVIEEHDLAFGFRYIP